MNYAKLQIQAAKKWKSSQDIRREYPTFVFYWHEQYERVYNIPHGRKALDKVLNVLH